MVNKGLSGGREEAERKLEDEFYYKVNNVISQKITPVYNTIILIFAAIFAYFVVMEENQCYAKGEKAWGVAYENTVDVTKQFNILCMVGLGCMLVSALMYYM